MQKKSCSVFSGICEEDVDCCEGLSCDMLSNHHNSRCYVDLGQPCNSSFPVCADYQHVACWCSENATAYQDSPRFCTARGPNMPSCPCAQYDQVCERNGSPCCESPRHVCVLTGTRPRGWNHKCRVAPRQECYEDEQCANQQFNCLDQNGVFKCLIQTNKRGCEINEDCQSTSAACKKHCPGPSQWFPEPCYTICEEEGQEEDDTSKSTGSSVLS